MKLAFEINDELDLTDEIPSALNAISTLVYSLPYLQKGVGVNTTAMTNASYFLSVAIDDVAQAVRDYADKKIAEQRKETKKC